MKYLKRFENVSRYKIGDYFLLKGDLEKEWITVNYKDTPSDYLIKNFFNNRDNYEIKYNLYPRVIPQSQIVAASKDKETVLQIAANKKFNI